MSKYVITNNFKLHAARQFLESITESSNSVYYLFAAKHIPFSGTIPTPKDTVKSQTIDIYRDLMFGKRVSSNDVVLMIKRHDWTTNTVYTMYDDTDVTLPTKEFFAVVNAGAYSHVWKCLDNHGGDPSTVAPNFADIDSDDEVYQTSDKYRWKYMYTASSSQVAKFATSDYFPVFANSVVSSKAVPGSIDVIKVIDGGEGYDNYFKGTFSSGDIRLNGNNLYYALPSSAASVNDFYTDCIIYLSSGTGTGQYKSILTSWSNATHKVIVVNTAFTTVPTNGTEYEIYPRVDIIGDRTETAVAEGRAIVNPSGNTIDRIELLTRGSDYKYSKANLQTHPVVGVTTNANIRVINSPRGGHGYDAAAELYAHHMCISVKYSNNESNTIPTKNDINQIGILRDPLFSNVEIELVGSGNGIFQGGEMLYKVEPVLVKGSATINLTSNVITASDADFANQFSVSDSIMLQGDGEFMLSTVTSIANSSKITIASNGTFACSSANVFLPRLTSVGEVTGYTTGIVSISNVAGVFSVNNYVLGSITGSYGQINSISRSEKVKNFDTFIGMYTYRVEMQSGVFSQNEEVFQYDRAVANAFVHSTTSLGAGIYLVYVTNSLGIFNIGETMSGYTSGAGGIILNKYGPEIHFNSGEVMYIENLDSVTRQNGQTETFKLIYEF